MSNWHNSNSDDAFLQSSPLSIPQSVPKKHGLREKTEFQTSSSGKKAVAGDFKREYVSGLMSRISARTLGAGTSNPSTRSRQCSINESPAPKIGNKITVGLSLASSVPKKSTGVPRPGVIRSVSNIDLDIKLSSSLPHAPGTKQGQKRGPISLGDSMGVVNGAPQLITRREPAVSKLSNCRESMDCGSQQPLPSQAESQSKPPRQSNRLIKKTKKQKPMEVIDLIDDSDSEDSDSEETVDYKQKLLLTVNAPPKSAVTNTSFGQLEKFPLKELYIGEERFAYTALPLLKSNLQDRDRKRKRANSSVVSGPANSTDGSERPAQSCSVQVNSARSTFKFTFPLSPSAAMSPLGIHEEVAYQNIASIRYSRIANSQECYACLELTDGALENFKNVKPLSSTSRARGGLQSVDEKTNDDLSVDEKSNDDLAIDKGGNNSIHALLIFPDDDTLLRFDLAFNTNRLLTATRDPSDLSSYLSDVKCEDSCVYDACQLPAFHSKYYILAHKLGVQGRKELRKSRRARRQLSAAKYNDSDAGMTLFCFPNDEFAQDTITFCKSDYIRLTDGEFLNDNVIDLQIKRSVLKTGEMRGLPLPMLQENAQESSKVSAEAKKLNSVEEVRSKALSPHNNSPVYAFSCMFYTKLTENLRSGAVNKSNMAEAHSVVSRWTKQVDIFTKDFIFFPINIGAHWSLVCVVRPGKAFPSEESDNTSQDVEAINYPCILFMDSLALHDKNRICNSISCYLMQEWLKKKNTQRDFWSKQNFPRIDLCKILPAQNNSYDCGVYLTKYAQLVCDCYPSSTIEDIRNKFSNWFRTDMFTAEDVERERLKIKDFCNEQQREWPVLLAARKKKKLESKEGCKGKNEVTNSDSTSETDSAGITAEMSTADSNPVATTPLAATSSFSSSPSSSMNMMALSKIAPNSASSSGPSAIAERNPRNDVASISNEGLSTINNHEGDIKSTMDDEFNCETKKNLLERRGEDKEDVDLNPLLPKAKTSHREGSDAFSKTMNSDFAY